MRNSNCRFPHWWARLAGVLVCAGLMIHALPSPAAGQTVWELTPYRIQLIVATAECAELTESLQSELQSDLVARIETVVGAAWDVTILPAPPRLRHLLTTDIDAATMQSLPEQSLEFDKVMLLGITPGPAGYQVSARELDTRTQLFSTTIRRPLRQLAKLRDVAFRVLGEAFAPLAQITGVEKTTVTLRLRAAGLPIRDKTWIQIRPGDVFLPVRRWNRRDGTPRKVEPVTWTFLIVKQITPKLFQCKMHSGIRSPLSGRVRGRVEQLALAVIPSGRPTQLTVRSRDESKRPLAGYQVYARRPDSKTARLIGLTDGQGHVSVPPGQGPVRILLIRSSGALLARLPISPGAVPQMTAEIPNDDRRLEAEGFITGLQENLIDIVTQRKVLEVRTRGSIKAGKLDEAEKLLDELESLDTRTELLRQMERQQDKLKSDDLFVQRKIDALFADTRKLLYKFLDREPIEQLGRELTKARQTSQ